MTDYRIGIGYDIHRLVEERPLRLGGVDIPYEKGLLGHSDSDVLLHAIIDAILGALGRGDIGEHFPDTDPAYCNISSAQLLDKVKVFIREQGYRLSNVDTVVIAQEPKLTPFKKKMRQTLAGLLGLDESRIGLKAKTNETLGELGRAEAIAAHAVVLLQKGAQS